MAKKIISKTLTFDGWNIVKFIKGRKRSVVALIATGLGYLLTNNELIAVASGLLFEMLISVGEYYLKTVKD